VNATYLRESRETCQELE